MPVRPFPLQLTVGTDICSIPRVFKLINRQKQESLNPFLRRLLSPREQKDFFHRFGSIDAIFAEARQTENSKVTVVARHLAGRWAAKEAVIKAYGSQGRRLTFWDIAITTNATTDRERSDPVTCLVLDPSAEQSSFHNSDAVIPIDEASKKVSTNFLSRDNPSQAKHSSESSDTDLHGQAVKISISHDSDYATAVCIAPLEPTPGDVGGEAAARVL